KVNKLNAFQIRLIDRGDGDFDLEFRYEDINWTAGDASGGLDGLGGIAARAGFGGTPNTPYVELPSSGTSSMLDVEDEVGNTGEAGLWLYSFTSGTPPTVAPTDIVLSGFGIAE